MTSQVDATIPADEAKVDKADFRAQFLVIKNEITALQLRTGVPGAKAFYGFVEPEDVKRLARKCLPGVARNTALGLISMTSL